MAKEINYTVALTSTKGNLTVGGNVAGNIDMAGTEMTGVIQTTSTSGTLVTFGSVNPPQFLYLRNADPTNSVQVGLDSALTNKFATLAPGQPLFIPTPGMSIYLKASAGTPNVEVVAIE